MRTRTKKMLSLLLAASMVFTMNTFAFAEEIVEDEAAVVEEAAEVVADDAAIEVVDEIAEIDSVDDVVELTADTPSSNSANSVSVSADITLSDNAYDIADDLAEEKQTVIKGTTNTYAIVYDNAVAYDGSKKVVWSGDSKQASKNLPVDVKVYYYKGTSENGISDNALSDNKAIEAAGWTEATIKKVKIKSAKGATVGLDRKALYAGTKNCTYIQSIKLEDKTMNKELAGLMKQDIKDLKKDKSTKVSGNGMIEGSDKYAAYIISVFPAYAGNDPAAQKVAKEIAGLYTMTLDMDKVKYKNGAPKKISGTIDGKKKVTLKYSKKPEKKQTGYGSVITCDKASNTLGYTSYVEADGNFAGNIYFNATSSK